MSLSAELTFERYGPPPTWEAHSFPRPWSPPVPLVYGVTWTDTPEEIAEHRRVLCDALNPRQQQRSVA